MILIISESNDYSTVEVQRWLDSFKASYIRINRNDKCKIIELDIESDKLIIELDGKVIDLMNLNIVWYRRGKFSFVISENDVFWQGIEKQEESFLNGYIFQRLESRKMTGTYLGSNVNKLYVLLEAKKVGLMIPETFISSMKKNITAYLDSNDANITKSIGVQIRRENLDGVELAYTETIDASDLENATDTFFPSLVQKKVLKKYEIRTFYFNGKFFSMAIFSQGNISTSVDFRKYDEQRPNRTVPFQLPSEIEVKLEALLNKLKLNTGSIDLILDSDNNFIFLEINPVGQFGMVSKPCNFQIEKYIAQQLLRYEYEDGYPATG